MKPVYSHSLRYNSFNNKTAQGMVWKNRCLTGTKPPDTVWGSYHFPSNFHNKATGPALKAAGLQSISPSGGPVPVRILFPVQQQ